MKNLVVLSGAGMSAESGISTFRDAGGLWDKYPVEQVATPEGYARNPELVINFYNERRKQLLEVRPNDGHLGLAELEADFNVTVVTQNIDGLHQKAGSEKVYELHGTIMKNYCMKCGQFYDLSYVMNSEGVPRCEKCGGMVKPDVVLYEEGLDDTTISKSVRAIAEADVLIIGGTSLNVYPAAGFINYYHGNKLVLINKSETPYDRQANLLIHDSIGKVLKTCVADL